MNTSQKSGATTFYNADGTPMNEKDSKRLTYLRQKFMMFLGAGKEYHY